MLRAKSAFLPLSNSIDIWATGLNVTWELDFWGRFRRAVEANQGTIDARNVPDKGCIFTVTLPRLPFQAEHNGAGRTPVSRS